ncbi:hypothetical protein D9611_001802 [Ephemerocybe angulata]|uniref:Uncharacterized protein n=1 Tax=Ephemerocybe angulata TaxID=980116 RepID=A0A8H5CIH9_9AGAR|nr:hypothetical protein D9611_001802 [Tulosesus angulatus]
MENEDEYVADSEEELTMDFDIGKAKSDWETEISTFRKVGERGDTEEPVPVKQVSSISDFTVQPQTTIDTISTSVSTVTTPAVKPPRPRPRPIAKKKSAEALPSEPNGIADIPTFPLLDQIVARANALSHPAADMVWEGDLPDFPALNNIMTSIADRAKTRQRKPTDTSTQQWDDIDFDVPQSSKKKAKSTAQSQDTLNPDLNLAPVLSSSKGKGKAPIISDVIELTDDEDELNITKKKSKPKPKPKPKALSPKPDTVDSTMKPPRPKPRPKPKKLKGPTEQLSSEPDPSKPISTPPHPPTDTDFISSSPNKRTRNLFPPSSLPPSDFAFPTPQGTFDLPAIETLRDSRSDCHLSADIPSSGGRKRLSEVDELFSGDEELFGPEPVDPNRLPPPPTFFAGSSQSHPANTLNPSKQNDGRAVDSPTFSTIPKPSIAVAANGGPLLDDNDFAPPKTKRKKKALEDDDDDADWGVAPSKPKEKKAPKKKKEKKVLPEVEVLIVTTPASIPADKAKKKKGKGKAKDEGGKAEAKEVFKSREMIEDSDEDPLQDFRPVETPDSILPPAASTTSGKEKGTPVSQEIPVPAVANPVPDDMDTLDDDEFPVKRKDSRKKRKSIVVDEDDDLGEASQSENSPNKRRKTNKKGKGAEAQEAAPAKSSIKKRKGKAKATLVLSEEEDYAPDPRPPSPPRDVEEEENVASKENVEPKAPEPSKTNHQDMSTPKPANDRPRQPRHSIANRARATPMSELIKRVNSHPNSPFPPASSARLPTISKIATSYSPYLKSSRSMLSKIAPLHPNRRTPPPPLPPPPPRRKTKKELEREERWEEEMVEAVGGIEVWAAMSDMERREMRKAKMDAEMGGWED